MLSEHALPLVWLKINTCFTRCTCNTTPRLRHTSRRC